MCVECVCLCGVGVVCLCVYEWCVGGVCMCGVCDVCVCVCGVCVSVVFYLIYLLHSMPHYTVILHSLHNLRFN